MMTDSAGLTIRRATAADAPAVAELARRTFMDAFAADSNPHDLALHAARTYGVPQQSAEIAHPGIITLLAEVDGHPPRTRRSAAVTRRRACRMRTPWRSRASTWTRRGTDAVSRSG